MKLLLCTHFAFEFDLKAVCPFINLPRTIVALGIRMSARVKSTLGPTIHFIPAAINRIKLKTYFCLKHFIIDMYIV